MVTDNDTSDHSSLPCDGIFNLSEDDHNTSELHLSDALPQSDEPHLSDALPQDVVRTEGTDTQSPDVYELPPLFLPMITKLRKVFDWAMSSRKGLGVAIGGLFVALVAAFFVWQYVSEEDETWLQPQEINESEDTTAINLFWHSLNLASDTHLQAFAAICYDRSQCHDELVKILRGPCIMKHYPPVPLVNSNTVDQEAIRTMSNMLQILLNNGRSRDVAWGVFPHDGFDAFASSTIKATSPDFCRAILQDHF